MIGTLLKYVALVIFSLWLLAVITSRASTDYDETLLPTANAALVQELFDGSGVITFYKQTNGLAPWFVYETPKSAVATKGLVFVARSKCGTRTCPGNVAELENAYGSRQVHLLGVIVDEHVVVADLTFAASPDARIEFFHAGFNKSGNASGVTLTPRIIGGTTDTALVWADVAHDGVTEWIFFQQGTLVPVGQRKVTLLYRKGGTLYFAVAVNY